MRCLNVDNTIMFHEKIIKETGTQEEQIELGFVSAEGRYREKDIKNWIEKHIEN